MRRSERLTSHRSLAVVAAVALALVGLAFDSGGYGNVAVASIAIVAWVAAGVAAWMLRPRFSGAAALMVFALAGLLVLSAFSMAWANDAGRAFDATERIAAYLGVLLVALTVIPRTGLRPWLIGLAVGIVAVGVIALATRCGASVFGNPDQSLFAALPSATGRLSYPIGYWNGLAALLGLGIVLLVWLADDGGFRGARRASIAAMPAMWLAIYLTSSRAGFAAALAGSVVVIWLGAGRTSRALAATLGALGGVALIGLSQGSAGFLAAADTRAAHRYGLLVAAAVVLVGALAAASDRVLDPRLRRARLRVAITPRLLVPVAVVGALVVLVAADPASQLHEFERPDFSAPALAPGQRPIVSAGGSGRYQFWSAAVHAWASSPVHGIGAGNYELYWNAHPGGPVAIRNAHSLYLETLAELGPLGLALLLVLLVAAPVALLRYGRPRDSDAAVAALGVVLAGAISAAVDWTFQLPAVFLPVVVCLAGVAVHATARGPLPARRRSRLALVAMLAIGWVAVWSGVVTLLTERALSASRSAVGRGDLAGAASDARQAASLEPFSPEPQIQLALIGIRAHQPDQARQAAADAVRLASGDWRTWLVAIQADFAAGDADAAHAAADQLAERIPVPLGTLSPK